MQDYTSSGRLETGLPGRRNLGRFRSPIHSFASVPSFLEHTEPHTAGIQSIWAAESFIDLLYAPKGSHTTLVMFHAGLTSSDVPLPIFAGGTVAAASHCNVIMVADSTLYAHPSLKIGWYAGTSMLKLQKLLPDILKRLLRDSGAEHIIFSGASAGGFAALYYSHHFPGSLAIPINPQTVIDNFGEQKYEFTRLCFGANDDATHQSVLREAICSDLGMLYTSDLSPHVLYLQNRSDDHVPLHLTPFKSKIRDPTKMAVRWGDWGNGHAAPSRTEIEEVICAAVSSVGSWHELLKMLAG